MKKKRTVKKKNYRKIQALVFAVIILASGFVYVRLRLPQPEPLRIAEISGNSSAVVEMSLDPSSVTLQKGTPVTVRIQMNTNGAAVTAAVVELSYDPSILGQASVTQGDFLLVKLNGPKVSNGTISFIYATPPEQKGKDGTGTIASVTFTPVADGTTEVSFTGNSIVAAVGFESNVLKIASGARFSSSSTQSQTATEPPVLVSNGAPADPMATMAAPSAKPQATTKKPESVKETPTNNEIATENPNRTFAEVNFGNNPGSVSDTFPLEDEFIGSETDSEEKKSVVQRFIFWLNTVFRRNK